MTQHLEPTQADREAAADWLANDDAAEDMQHFAAAIRSGAEDEHSLVQAFAAHRLAHTRPVPPDVGELIERAFASVENQMDNFLPAKGEAWEGCFKRRLLANLTELQRTGEREAKLEGLLREARAILENAPVSASVGTNGWSTWERAMNGLVSLLTRIDATLAEKARP